MTKKYRLSIPKKIKANDGLFMCKYLLDNNGKIVEAFSKPGIMEINIGNDPALIEVPKDWLQEIKEPVVLSAEEIYNKMMFGVGKTRDFVIKYGESCDQNGQLREWLRPEQVELREAIKAWVNRIKLDGYPLKRINREAEQVIKALENLKPPYERDDD